MDELEWLKENSPSARPSREVTSRHRTQLRAAIAAERADGTRPRRPRRERRSRHRVLVTTAVIVALCAAGAGVIALTSSGGDDGATVGAPVSHESITTAPAQACAGAPPKELAVPAGFGTAVAAPAKDAAAAPSSTQQVTSWTSGQATIEQRWPADAAKVPERTGKLPDDSISAVSDQFAKVDGQGVARQTIVFSFGGQAAGCADLQVTISGRDAAAVETITSELVHTPFRSNEPLVTTTA